MTTHKRKMKSTKSINHASNLSKLEGWGTISNPGCRKETLTIGCFWSSLNCMTSSEGFDPLVNNILECRRKNIFLTVGAC
jgi:hypothetical protein